MIHRRLTLTEQFEEREYRIQERLGILCEDGPITESALAIAEAEGDDWVRRYNGVKKEKVHRQPDLL